jgi:hypothetical protein
VTFRDQAILAALPGTIRARTGIYIRTMNAVGPGSTITFRESLEAAVEDAVKVADLAVVARVRRKKVAGREDRT